MTDETCTVVVAADGETCGRPAVTTFTGRNGETFAECADHDASFAVARRPTLEVGATVRLRKYGRDTTGVVRKVGVTRARVSVELADGRTKDVAVALAELASPT